MPSSGQDTCSCLTLRVCAMGGRGVWVYVWVWDCGRLFRNQQEIVPCLGVLSVLLAAPGEKQLPRRLRTLLLLALHLSLPLYKRTAQYVYIVAHTAQYAYTYTHTTPRVCSSWAINPCRARQILNFSRGGGKKKVSPCGDRPAR